MVPFILVGTKLDARSDQNIVADLKKKNQSPITISQGQQMCDKLNGKKYLECSAKTQQGLKEVFDEAIKVTLAARNNEGGKKSKCSIL